MTRTATSTSVVTIVRGRAAHLRNLVGGLGRGRSLPAALHVVVMGGEDPTTSLPTPGFPVRTSSCPPSDDRLPLARARNVGVEAVTTPYVVLLDVDCIPGAELVAAYEDLLSERDVVAMGEVRYLAADATSSGWDEPSLRSRSQPHPARSAPARAQVTDRHELFWSLSFAARRATYRQLGGFDEGFVGYGAEDTDLGFRIRDEQVPLWWAPDAVAYHQHHATSDPPFQHLHDIVRNARRFRARWGVWPMEGWLRAFADAGVVRWDARGEDLEVQRRPTPTELAAARRP